jgi:hypothetical protein
MPERGGPTTQSGIYYQNSVAALFLGQLCDERTVEPGMRVVCVRVEAPEDVDDTVVTYADNHIVYVQAKERITAGDKAWVKMWKDFATQYERDTFTRGRDRLRLQLGTPTDAWEALRDLADRARTSVSPVEWEERITEAGRAVRNEVLPHLPPPLSVNEEALRQFFAHLDVQVWTLEMVDRDLVGAHMPNSDKYPGTLFSLIRDTIGGTARLRGTYHANGLRERLSSEHQVTFDLPPDVNAILGEVQGTGALLRQHKNTIGQTGVHLPRATTGELVRWVKEPDPEKPVALVLDNAGFGKTVVMRDVLQALDELRIPTIAIKADQQLSGIRDESEVAARLGLSASVEAVVSRLSVRGRVVVIVDQVDALSLSMARDQAGLNAVLGLVARVRRIPGVVVLLSCRTFDRNTDPRLKKLEVGREFTVTQLEPPQVTELLAQLGIDASYLNQSTLELLRVPLHLDLFATLVAAPGDQGRLRGIESLQDLYAQLWDVAVLGLTPGGHSSSERVKVLRMLTERMDREQRTSVPKTVLAEAGPETAAAAVALGSNGVLVSGATEVTFLHQTFFDYCFARFFVEDRKSISEIVLASKQGLFERSQVVQVLAFLRATDDRTYLRELWILLTKAGLRVHLRELVLRWFGSVAKPSDGEWAIAQRVLSDSERRPHMLRAFGSNADWFERLNGGLLARYLDGDPDWVDKHLLPYLTQLAATSPDALSAVIDPWLNQGEGGLRRAFHVLRFVRSWTNTAMCELFTRLAERVPLDQLMWLVMQLDDMAKARPEEACKAIRVILSRIIKAYRQRGEGEKLWRAWGRDFSEIGGHSLVDALSIAGENAPQHFLDEIVPWFIGVLNDEGPGDNGTDSRHFPGDVFRRGHSPLGDEEGELLATAIRSALAAPLLQNGPTVEAHIAVLSSIESVTPQTIVASVFRDFPKRWAQAALNFLLGDPRRLRLGDGDSALSRSLVSTIVPHVSSGDLQRLELHVIAHTGRVPEWNRSVEGLRWRGLDQLFLLEAIGYGNLSGTGKDRLGELRRKFPGERARERSPGVTVGFVGSPIDAGALERMSDDQWLNAMRRYAGPRERHEFLRGGAQQLAAELQAKCKLAPARYMSLAMRVPEGADEAYRIAIIRGIGESNGATDWTVSVARRFAFSGGRWVRRAAADALRRASVKGMHIPEDLRALLEETALGESGEDEDLGEGLDRDPYHRCINSDRGTALSVLLQDLRLEGSAETTERYWRITERVAADQSAALRAGAIADLVFMLASDAQRAVEVFEKLSDGVEQLRISHPFHLFLFHAAFKRFARLGRYVEEVMNSSAVEARQLGAEIAAVYRISPGALEDENAKQHAERLFQQAIAGDMPWRTGVAKVLAHNLDDLPVPVCADGLKRLLNDDAKEVRSNVASVVHRIRGFESEKVRGFLLDYARSASLWSGLYELSEQLWEAGIIFPEWALDMVQAILDNDTRSEDQWERLAGGERLVRLVLRIVSDPTGDPILVGRAMDLFDRLMEQHGAEAVGALTEWDRR